MNYCFVDNLQYLGKKFYLLKLSENLSIVAEPTKYLKHKFNSNCSPNTLRTIAFSLCYYICYLKELNITVDKVLLMKYAEQQEHFVNFLYWLRAGNHTSRSKIPNNNTCNSYLGVVFGYYEFLLLEYEKDGDIKVLDERSINYSTAVGTRISRYISTFSGYLPKEKSIGRTIDADNLLTILDSALNVRDKLLILLIAETGFRIGELLGIRYSKDIDFEQRTIKVSFRDDNDNMARAKNAETRTLKISKDTMAVMEVYISEDRHLLKNTEFLFVTLFGDSAGKPLDVNAVYALLKRLEDKTKIKVTPHMIRHYFANERRKNGWAIEMISNALGHKSIKTTELYMNIEQEEVNSAIDDYYSNTESLYNISKLI